jgi:hypothetical protein
MNFIFQVIKIKKSRLFLTISFFALLFFVFSINPVKASFADCGITATSPFWQIKAPDGSIIAQIDSAGNMELNSTSINQSAAPSGTFTDTFLIQNSTGVNRFSFNKNSSYIAGTILSAQTQATLNSISGDDLVIKNSSGVIKGRFDMATGNIYLSGQACLPFIPVTSCEDLQKIGNDISFPIAANYKLAPDSTKNYGNNYIDCRATNPNNPENNNSIWDYDIVGSYGYGDGTIGGAKGFRPILNFARIFDGKNNYIKNLYINRPAESNVGLFGAIGQNTEIKNIKFTNINIIGNNYVGGLVGRTISNAYYSKILNCVFDSSGGSNTITSSTLYTGGIAGYADRASISNSNFSGNVIGAGQVGGLVGYLGVYALNGTYYNISSCFSSGSVVGTGDRVGGLAGSITQSGSDFLNAIESSKSSSAIRGVNYVGGIVGDIGVASNNSCVFNSSSSGDVFGFGSRIGGLIGQANVSSYVTVAQESYSTGSVSGINYVGGLAGYVSGTNTAKLNYVYATGKVEGSSYVGGLTGWAKAEIRNSYSSGMVSGSSNIGGFIGYFNGGTIYNSYWDKDVSSQISGCSNACSNVNPLSTSQMVSLASPTNQTNFSGWNFSSYWKLDSINSPGYYPCLQRQANSTCVKAPIIISNCEQLQRIGIDIAYPLNEYYSLIQDIDCSATNPISPNNDGSLWDYDNPASYGYGDGTVNGARGFKPIGVYDSKPFTGIFNGQGFEITNLYINRVAEDKVGLFLYAYLAKINNLTITNIDITGRDQVGGLIGYGYYASTTNINISGKVSGNDGVGGLIGGFPYSSVINSNAAVAVNGYRYVGGLVGNGWLAGSITNSCASGSVNGYRSVGGLIGYSFSVSSFPIVNSCATGNVVGDNQVGGLVGYTGDKIVITDSYAAGNVTGINGSIGGLVGEMPQYSLVSSSYATGEVIGNTYVGGLVGWAWNYSSIKKSYAHGSVFGNNQVGGLIGANSHLSSLEDSYATGNVSGNNGIGGLVGWLYGSSVTNSYASGHVDGLGNAGGLVGSYGSGSLSNNYWNKESSGQLSACGYASCFGVTGLTTAEMKVQSSYAGFDFATPIWKIPDSYYACLNWQADNTCVKIPAISSCQDLQDIQKNLYGDYFLTADLDCTMTSTWNSGKGFAPLGNFYGTLDGREHKIFGLVINNSSHANVGIVSGNYGTIENLTLDNFSVNASNSSGGASLVASTNGGIISNINITNSFLFGSTHVGSLAGENLAGGTISDSIVQANVVALSNYAGGVAGGNDGNISNTGFLGNVTDNTQNGTINIGGFAGTNNGKIEESFSGNGRVMGRSTSLGSLFVGGFIGTNLGEIDNCYSTMTYIAAQDFVGGFGGNLGGIINNSYSIGQPAPYLIFPFNGTGGGFNAQGPGFLSSYWNTQTSGYATSAGGVGKTTAQMTTQISYSGWDFTNIWTVNDGISYPCLKWYVNRGGSCPTP